MYDGATYFAWLVLALLFAVAVGLIVWIGTIPKKIAMKRNHPQVDAINACSWIGLAVGGIGWPIAFVWAFLRSGPVGSQASDERSQVIGDHAAELEALRDRISKLERQLQDVTGKKDQS